MLPNLSENYLTRGFWGDEAWTSLISQLPYVQMLQTTAADFHPPGYYTVVGFFYLFLPPTEIVTRFVSIAFYLLTVLLVFLFTKEIKGEKFGLLAATLVLVSPVFFTYAFEARNYTMFAFASTGSFYFLFRLLKNFSLKNAFVFIIFSAIGVYTHYYMFFVLAAQGLYILIFARRILLKMSGLYFVVAITYLPWIPLLYNQVVSVKESYWISSINSATHIDAIYRVLVGEKVNIIQPFLLVLSLTLLGVGLFYFIRKIVRNDSPEKTVFIFMWFWVIISFILASLPGLDLGVLKLPFRPIFFWRYLIPTAVPFSILIAIAIYSLPKKLKLLSAALFIIMSVSISYLIFLQYPFTFKQVYEKNIITNINQDDKIVTVLPSFAEVLYYQQRNGLENETIVLTEGLVQFSGKSLLDAYVENGVVKIDEKPRGRYIELRPGPSVKFVGGLGF